MATSPVPPIDDAPSLGAAEPDSPAMAVGAMARPASAPHAQGERAVGGPNMVPERETDSNVLLLAG